MAELNEKEINESIRQTTNMLLTPSGMTVAEARKYNEMIKNDSGKNGVSIEPRRCLENVRIILNNDVRFRDRLCYNEVDMRIYKKAPFPWDNSDDSGLKILNDDYDVLQMKRMIQRDYMQNVKDVEEQYVGNAMEKSFNPVIELLESLKWDGKEHIRYLMPKYLGVNNDTPEDDDYQYKCLLLQMLTLIERQKRDNVKMDIAMALIGPQGLGKSTFTRQFAFDDASLFTDELGDLTQRDTLQVVAGKRVIEFGELLALKKTREQEAVKRFLSSTMDTFRPPYAKTYKDYPRRCVIIATTNDIEFLSDATGARRWCICECNASRVKDKMAIQYAHDEFMAAWGEAMHIWREMTHNGKDRVNLVQMCYDLAPEAAKHAARHEETDPYEGEIGVYLEALANDWSMSYDKQEQMHDKKRPRVCAKQIAKQGLMKIDPSRFELKDISRLIDYKFPEWKRCKTRQRCGEFGLQTCWEYVGDDKKPDIPQSQTEIVIQPEFVAKAESATM